MATPADPLPPDLAAKRDRLLAVLGGLPGVAVAFSGGVDSAVVAKAAHLALGDRAVAVTADSPSVPRSELADARRLAELVGIRHVVVGTNEFADPDYLRNDGTRCYHCKSELYGRIAELLPALGVPVMASGANLDDRGDYRPGLVAAAEHRVRHPLQEAGFTKADVRAVARAWGLPAWDKPASPCLSSRLAPGLAVTPERTRRVEEAEAFLRSLGLRDCRVRYHEGDLARVEVPAGDIARLAEEPVRAELAGRLKALGFRYVALDLDGFRTGSLNGLIPLDVRRRFGQDAAASPTPPPAVHCPSPSDRPGPPAAKADPMPIKVTCSNCGGVLHAPDNAAGKKGRCPTCGTILQIAADGPPAAPAGTPDPADRATRPVPYPKTASGNLGPPVPESAPTDAGGLGGSALHRPMASGGVADDTPGKRSTFGTLPPPPDQPPRKQSMGLAPPPIGKPPADARRSSEPFRTPLSSPPSAVGGSPRAWRRARGGLGWVRAGVFFYLVAVFGLAGLVVAEQVAGVSLPATDPGLLQVQGLAQRTEIRLAVVLIPLALGVICVTLGRLSAAAVPPESSAKGLARMAAFATLLKLAGVVVLLFVTGAAMAGGFVPDLAPGRPVAMADGLPEKVQRYVAQMLTQWSNDDPVPIAQRLGLAAVVVFGLAAELWFVAALGRMAASLHDTRAAGRVNRFVMLVGLLFVAAAAVAVAVNLFGSGWFTQQVGPHWDGLDPKVRAGLAWGGIGLAGLLVAVIYLRMLGGVRRAVREWLERNPG